MPLDIVGPPTSVPPAHGSTVPRVADQIVIALVNNMPDSALQATEAQFFHLLQAAAGPRSVALQFTYLPEVVRGPAARERIGRSYWPIEALLHEPPDALIVTGAEPLARTLADEPYWQRFVEVLDWAESHTVSSIWSCLAAHAAVAHLDGIARRRLAQKCCGVFEHSILAESAVMRGVGAPLHTPHSRWNELPVEALRAAGYSMLSESAQTGADIFARQSRSMLLFFQGHPEYEDTTLLKEYGRDVSRFLSAQQPHYPTLPAGYFSPESAALLDSFREQAMRHPATELVASFPFTTVAAGLQNSWRADAIRIYGNWLSYIANTKTGVAPAAIPRMLY
jgi:homoserine O-succinyltransferase